MWQIGMAEGGSVAFTAGSMGEAEIGFTSSDVSTSCPPIRSPLGLRDWAAGVLQSTSRAPPWLSSPLSVVLAMSLPLTGCTSIRVPNSGDSVSHYFGYVRIEHAAEDSPGAVATLNVNALGVWVSPEGRSGKQGGGLGYVQSRSMRMPLDCRVVFNLTSDVQLKTFTAALKDLDLDKERICITHP